MNISLINTLIFNFDVFYMFRTRGDILRKTVVYAVMVWDVLRESLSAV